MFFGKVFTIVSAVLAVAVNGSPIEAAGRELQAVRHLRGSLDVDPSVDVDDGEI